ncbi:MAG: hypothetical protein K6A23_04630 [Butyrivibrio sp.]|nr:hypothetical protein [Butyrivibrio sp.]
MSINRIDFQGTILRSGDVAQHAGQDASKVAVDHNNFAEQFTREIDEKATSVNETNKTEQQEEKFDAKEEGKNKYYSDEKEKEKKKKQDDELSKGFAGKSAQELEKMAGNMITRDGKHIQLDLSSGFDFKI